MLKQVCVLVAVLLLVPVLEDSGTENARLTLVRDGEPMATIVVARQAMDEPAPKSEFLQHYPHVVWNRLDAAKELQRYIKKISRAKLPIFADDKSIEGTMILVGERKHARDPGLTIALFARQEYLIRADGDRVMLMGHDETYDDWINGTRNVGRPYGGCFSPLETYQAIGTKYSITSFLEYHCGVRWYFPGEIGEVAPKTPTLTVPAMNVRRKPSTRHRMVSPDLMPPKLYVEQRLYQPVSGSRFPAYELKDQVHNEVGTAWGRRLKLGGDVFNANHSLYGYYNRFAKAHPEWFANGKPGRG